MPDSEHPELEHLIYDGCGGAVRGKDGEPKGSVRPTGEAPLSRFMQTRRYTGELPPLTSERLQDCIRVRRILERQGESTLTTEQADWLEFVSQKIDDWNSDYDPPEGG